MTNKWSNIGDELKAISPCIFTSHLWEARGTWCNEYFNIEIHGVMSTSTLNSIKMKDQTNTPEHFAFEKLKRQPQTSRICKFRICLFLTFKFERHTTPASFEVSPGKKRNFRNYNRYEFRGSFPRYPCSSQNLRIIFRIFG